ncbi:MAG: 50S ribosomal protein L11 [Conexivisphaerales archaeon]
MAEKEKKAFNFIVPGGEANAGPPIGPALGPLALNVMQVVKKINDLTADYKGMKVPVSVEVYSDKTFNVVVKLPPTSALILKEIGLQKGSAKAGTEWAGNISFDSVVKIAKSKYDNTSAKTLKGAIKMIVGTCASLGIKVENKTPEEVLAEINSGAFDTKVS